MALDFTDLRFYPTRDRLIKLGSGGGTGLRSSQRSSGKGRSPVIEGLKTVKAGHQSVSLSNRLIQKSDSNSG
jgi:hypothetical protein